MLSNMNTKFGGMKDDLKDMWESLSGFKQEVQELRDEISDLRYVSEDLKSDNVNLRKRMADIERQIDDQNADRKETIWSFMDYGELKMKPGKSVKTWCKNCSPTH